MSFVDTTLSDAATKGTTGGPRYKTVITSTASGYEDRIPKWTQARHEYNINFDSITQEAMYDVLKLYHAMQGNAYSFRMKDWQDYNSVTPLQDISATDQIIGNGDGATAAYQLVKNYTDGLTYQRTITKPKPGTVLTAIGEVESTTNFSVNTSTGLITFDDISGVITNAVSSGVLTTITDASHGLVTGDTVYIDNFTGDWTAINDDRYLVTVVNSSTYTIEYDSSGFTAYSSNGGTTETLPQTGEQVTAGFEFDVHVRFNIGDELLDISWENIRNQSISIPLIEVRG